jgi:hypothetical protein
MEKTNFSPMGGKSRSFAISAVYRKSGFQAENYVSVFVNSLVVHTHRSLPSRAAAISIFAPPDVNHTG